MKGADPMFLVGKESLLYNYSGSVHLHLGVDGQHGVDPDSHCQAGHGHYCLSVPLAELGVAGGGGAKVQEVLDDLECEVTNGDA